MNNNIPKIFCAIDKPDLISAKKLCTEISKVDIGIKLGLEFFNALGPQGILEIHQEFPNTPLFIDLKYHDIPNTVASAIKSVTAQFKPAFLNVHASGGLDMIKAAKAACPPQTKLLAVTILTSLDDKGLNEVGYKENMTERVIQLALLTKQAGLDGVVCSAHEIDSVRAACGNDFITMVPGIRPAGSDLGDQKRAMTPREAMDKGATHLVIGRPITQSANPAQTAQEILNTLQ